MDIATYRYSPYPVWGNSLHIGQWQPVAYASSWPAQMADRLL